MECALDVLCFLQPQPHNADGWDVLVRAVQASSHVQRLPLCTQAELRSRRASAQRPPVTRGVFLLGVEEVGEPDAHIANDGVFEELAIVNDLYRDDGCRLIRAQEFGRRLPDRVVSVFETRRLVDGSWVRAEVDLGERIEIARNRFGGIEVFGLMNRKTDNANIYGDI